MMAIMAMMAMMATIAMIAMIAIAADAYSNILVLFFLVGETDGLHIVDVLADSIADIFTKGAVSAEIAGLELLCDAEHVLKDENLSIRSATCSDTDCGYLQFLRNLCGQLGGYLL